jgi:hypothetical protein
MNIIRNNKATFIVLLLSFFFIDVYQANGQVLISVKNENGAYKIPIKINGFDITLNYKEDETGIVLSVTETQYMLKNGFLANSDFKHTTELVSVSENTETKTSLNIRLLQLEEVATRDVEARVVLSLDEPPVIGKAVLSKFGKVSYDIDRNLIVVAYVDSTARYEGYVTRNATSTRTTISKETSSEVQDVDNYLGSYLYKTQFNSPAANPSIREFPSLNSKVIHIASRNSPVFVIDETDNVFLKVYVEGYTGYVSRRFVKGR